MWLWAAEAALSLLEPASLAYKLHFAEGRTTFEVPSLHEMGVENSRHIADLLPKEGGVNTRETD